MNETEAAVEHKLTSKPWEHRVVVTVDITGFGGLQKRTARALRRYANFLDANPDVPQKGENGGVKWEVFFGAE